MDVLYVHCPFCTFPYVVSELTADKPRYCRQCRGIFSPVEKNAPRLRPTQATRKPKRKGRRIALRSMLNKR